MGAKKLTRFRPEYGNRERQRLNGENGEASELKILFPAGKNTWEEFYRSQTQRLTRIAAGVGVPSDRIEDVLQEVWLDAVRHREGFQGGDAERRLSAWLTTVVRSKSRDALRRLYRRRYESLDGLAEELVDRGAEIKAELINKSERSECLSAMLEEVRQTDPLNYRLLCGRFLEGRSIRDLASETDLGIHAVACRISRVVKKLRKLVG